MHRKPGEEVRAFGTLGDVALKRMEQKKGALEHVLNYGFGISNSSRHSERKSQEFPEIQQEEKKVLEKQKLTKKFQK